MNVIAITAAIPTTITKTNASMILSVSVFMYFVILLASFNFCSDFCA